MKLSTLDCKALGNSLTSAQRKMLIIIVASIFSGKISTAQVGNPDKNIGAGVGINANLLMGDPDGVQPYIGGQIRPYVANIDGQEPSLLPEFSVKGGVKIPLSDKVGISLGALATKSWYFKDIGKIQKTAATPHASATRYYGFGGSAGLQLGENFALTGEMSKTTSPDARGTMYDKKYTTYGASANYLVSPSVGVGLFVGNVGENCTMIGGQLIFNLQSGGGTGDFCNFSY